MTTPEFKFDNPNNGCLSLRIAAELIRSGDYKAEDWSKVANMPLRDGEILVLLRPAHR